MAASNTGKPLPPKPSVKSRLLESLKNIWESSSAIAKQVQSFNIWLAKKLSLSPVWSQRLVNIEITALLVGGATTIQLGEYALAIAFWLTLALIWVSKVISWQTISGSRQRIIVVKTINITLAMVAVSVMVIWTNIKRGDEYWTALEKIFDRSDLVVLTFATNREYASGTTISGIVWQPDYTELDVVINNPSDSSYEDLNVLVRPDYPVAKIAQMGNLPGCSFEDKMGLTVRATQEEAPLYPSGAPFGPASPYTLLATSAGYRVHCDRIPQKSSLRLVFALIAIKKSIPYKSGMRLPPPSEMELSLELNYSTGESYWWALPGTHRFASRPNPANLTLDGSYIFEGKKQKIKRIVPVG